jgi:Flp pilus assembly protein TadG
MSMHQPKRTLVRCHRGSRRARGITMVEFVIVFPLATLFVLSLIQMGMAYMAKLTLNHATFMAARVGALHNANKDEIREALIRGLSPFYQDSTISNDTERLGKAYLAAKLANAALNPLAAEIEVLNPSEDAFTDFGVKDPKTKVTYIPNDNLEWRGLTVGAKSKLNIRDANLLKLRVVYGYEMKVPVIAGVMSRVMCGGSIGVEAYGNVKVWQAVFGPVSKECLKYYQRGRMPIESFAIVEMQTPAEQSK